MHFILGPLVIVLYIVSARYVLKRLRSRRQRAITWMVIILTWAPPLLVSFGPAGLVRSEVAPPFVGTLLSVLLAGFPGLLALMPLVALGVAIARAKGTGRAKGVVVTTVLLGYVVLFGDEIAGRLYLSYLCATKAGVKVYRTVELPAEYWEADGMPRYYREFDLLLGRHYAKKYQQGRYSSLFQIENAGHAYLDRGSGQVLGEATDFRYWGGWVRRTLSPHNSANSCIDYSQPQNKLIDRIFVREYGVPTQRR